MTLKGSALSKSTLIPIDFNPKLRLSTFVAPVQCAGLYWNRGGGGTSPHLLADQLTLSQLGGADYFQADYIHFLPRAPHPRPFYGPAVQ